MPRVCRCCCKSDIELLSLFEANDGTNNNHNHTTQTHQLSTLSLRRRQQSTTTVTQQQQKDDDEEEEEGQQHQQHHQQQQSHQLQKRKSDNPVDYALSGAHSNMDTVLEEMIIWMLNVSTTTLTKPLFVSAAILPNL